MLIAFLKTNWWKLLGILLVLYSIVFGFLGAVPALDILNESIRNLYFHVPMWFAMIGLLIGSLVHSIKYLSKQKLVSDFASASLNHVALLLGFLGILTGMLWAKSTWGTYWTNDPKLNGVAIGMLIYLAYMILRSAIDDEEKRARVAAVYNVFAFPLFVVLILVLPRLTDSLHPGNGGNPGFSNYDLKDNMKPIFYAAVLGWNLIGFWMASILLRLDKLKNKIENV
jgi:heme exporter protein C